MEIENKPKHIALILDGNRRWARERKLPIALGHKKGVEILEKIVRYANNIGIEYITVYAFSTENWKRSEEEVSTLMQILKNYLDSYLKKANTENIKVNIIGDISRLPEGLQKSNTGIVFSVAINYGGRDEIKNAVKKIASEVKNGNLQVEDINEDLISKNLYTWDIPDPDIIVRTSGEYRISGFLTWQSVYSELLFLDKYWPDFTEEDIDNVIEVYSKRNRRIGK